MTGTAKTRCAHDWRVVDGGTVKRCRKCKRERPIGQPATTRNRACACEHGCGSKLRASRAQLDRGLYVCPCGGAMVPSAMEDAMRAFERGHLTREQLDAHSECAAYAVEIDRLHRGRHSSDVGLNVKPLEERSSREARLTIEDAAASRVYKTRAAAAYASRLAALEPHRFGGAPSSDSIPF